MEVGALDHDQEGGYAVEEDLNLVVAPDVDASFLAH